jgi:uncharacterized iron-regulated membrane protein
MPTLEALDYERFSYDEANENPLTLDEAVKKAKALRRKDAANFYRIKHTDEGGTSFVVTKVPVSSVYADFVAHAAKVMNRYVRRIQHR